jgi:hypothetical protein
VNYSLFPEKKEEDRQRFLSKRTPVKKYRHRGIFGKLEINEKETDLPGLMRKASWKSECTRYCQEKPVRKMDV